MITAESVSKASDVIDEFTDEELDEAFEHFFATQPALLEYLSKTKKRDDAIVEFLVYLSYFVFTAYDAQYPGKPVTLQREDFSAAFEKVKAWVGQLDGLDSVYAEFKKEPLLNYIGLELNTPFDDGTTLGPVERLDVFITIKTVMVSLDLAARRQGVVN